MQMFSIAVLCALGCMFGLCFTRTEKIKFYTNAVRYTEQNPNYLKTEYDILEGTLNQNVYLASK